MKFGIGYYSLQSPKHRPRKHADLYREMLDEVKSADDMGFDSAWLTEHHFLSDGYCPSLMVAAGAVAAVTSRIRIGTGVLLIPLHNAIRIAEDSAVVDNISGGRLILGLGLGYRPEEFDGFGVSLKHRRGRMEESLEILKNSWSDKKFSMQGKHYSFKDLYVTPKPVQKPIPIWIGAFTEPAIRRAAKIGAPLYVPAIGVIPVIKALFDMHSNMLAEYGFDPEKIEKPLVREIYITKSEPADKVWEKIKEHITYTAKGYASWGSMVDTEGNLLSDPNDPVLYDIARKQSIIGTPPECIDAISEYKDRLPVDNLICRFKFPGISHEEAMNSMKLFIDKVAPKIL